jgi:Transmembrane secretion effector
MPQENTPPSQGPNQARPHPPEDHAGTPRLPRRPACEPPTRTSRSPGSTRPPISATFMQTVGAAWLMVSLGAGPMKVALIQTATTLPFFALALPAGALGDIVDRWRIILITEYWMLGAAIALAVVTIRQLEEARKFAHLRPDLIMPTPQATPEPPAEPVVSEVTAKPYAKAHAKEGVPCGINNPQEKGHRGGDSDAPKGSVAELSEARLG